MNWLQTAWTHPTRPEPHVVSNIWDVDMLWFDIFYPEKAKKRTPTKCPRGSIAPCVLTGRRHTVSRIASRPPKLKHKISMNKIRK